MVASSLIVELRAIKVGGRKFVGLITTAVLIKFFTFTYYYFVSAVICLTD